jgi:hypothetical protein
VFAVAYFLLSVFHVTLSAEQRVALTIAGIGASVALISRWFVTILRERLRYEDATHAKGDELINLISTWARFEELSKSALGLEDSDVNRRSPRAIFYRLRDEGRLTESDIENLDQAIQIRNQVVHSTEPVPIEAVRHARHTLRELMRKLSPTEELV